MKRIICILIIMGVLACFTGCSPVRVKQTAPAETARTTSKTTVAVTLPQLQSTTQAQQEVTEETGIINSTVLPSTTAKTTLAVTQTTSETTTQAVTKQPPFGLNIVRNGIGRFFGYEENVSTQPAEKPTLENGGRDYSYFDNSAFVGNSRILDFGTFGFAKNVYASVGLTVETVFTAKVNGTAAINKLNGKNFSKVYLYFGDNECGWQSMEKFQEQYKKVIDAVKARCPEAEIYLVSVMPISRSASSANQNGYNISSIRKINTYIKELAENEDVKYLDTYSSTSDPSGFLPEEAASDGIHMNKKYIQRWAEFIYDKT